MKIYDRYKLDSSEERQRQTDGIAKARRGIRQDSTLYRPVRRLALLFSLVFWSFCGCSRTPFQMLFLQACAFCWE